MAQILAIEPDPERIVILRRLVSEKLDADVIVADSMERAIETLDAKRPDVIVTSSLLSPGDDQQLAEHLRQAPSLDHPPVLMLPPLVDTDDADSSRGLISWLFRRRRQSWPTYDAAPSQHASRMRFINRNATHRSTQISGSGLRACS